MPILEKNKVRYPKNWAKISESIRERDCQKCCFCGVKNGVIIHRLSTSEKESYYQYPDSPKLIYCADTGQQFDLSDITNDIFKTNTLKIVLTVAHLDHTPENCDPSNLKSLCQRCHNKYDAEHRKQTRKETLANSKPNQGQLFNS